MKLKFFVVLGLVALVFVAGILLAQTQHNVSLNWAASPTPNVTYNVYRSATSGGPYSQINVSPVTNLNYLDTNVSSGATYFYVIRAFDGTDVSTPSNEAKAVVPQGPQPPSSLTATAK